MSIYAIMLVLIRETPGIEENQHELIVYSAQGSQSLFIESSRNGDHNAETETFLVCRLPKDIHIWTYGVTSISLSCHVRY